MGAASQPASQPSEARGLAIEESRHAIVAPLRRRAGFTFGRGLLPCQLFPVPLLANGEGREGRQKKVQGKQTQQ